jgi:hypothetical protein
MPEGPPVESARGRPLLDSGWADGANRLAVPPVSVFENHFTPAKKETAMLLPIVTTSEL